MKLQNTCFAVALLITSCSVDNEIRGEAHYSEKIQSLPGKIVVTKDGSGATTSEVFRVYVENTDTGKNRIVLLADNVQDLHVYMADREIRIFMKCGRVFEYTNFADLISAEGRLIARVPILLEGGEICENS